MKKLSEKNFFLMFLIISFVILCIIGSIHIISSDYINRMVYESHRVVTEKLIRTAENGLSQYLKNIQNDMEILSDDDAIIHFNSKGKKLIEEFQKDNENLYSNVSRVNVQGRLEYTYPENPSALGRDLMHQEHNKKLFKENVNVISRPFMAVQGYEAIAVAIPIFKNKKFDGGITALIPFDRLWDLFLTNVKPTPNSFVIVANQDGGIVYSPEYMDKYDNVNQMLEIFRYEDSLFLDTTRNYTLRRISVIQDINREIKSSRLTLVKSSIKIGESQNVWYLLVYTPDRDIKSLYQAVFRTQTVFAYLIIILLVMSGVSFVKILNEKVLEKNKLVAEIFEEKKLTEGEKEFLDSVIKSILKINGLFVFVLKSDGNVVFHNQQPLPVSNFYEIVESSKAKSVKESLDFIYEKNRVTAMMIEINLGSKFVNILFNISSFEAKDEKFTVLLGFEYSRIRDVGVMSEIFNDSFKKWFAHEKTLCFIDGSLNVLSSNRAFQIKFNNSQNIRTFIQDGIQEIEKSVKEIYENVNEVSLDFHADKTNYKMSLVPVVNEFLKVECISVEIS